jgi:prevent-host-death family protein
MRRVAVRALRQNLSVYLRKVAAGESFEVTARGRSVAQLRPLPAAGNPIERLAAAGRASAPAGDLLELGPPEPPRGRTRLSDSLERIRADRG